jgi:hypothetical protein
MRRTFESQDTHWNGTKTAHLSSYDVAHGAGNWPKPSELFFETGIVLAAALGLCAVVDVILAIAGIPDVY